MHCSSPSTPPTPPEFIAASRALRAIGALRRRLFALEKQSLRRIQRLEVRDQARMRPLRERLHGLERELERLARGLPGLAPAGGRLELPAGTLGLALRRVLRPAPGRSWAEVAQSLDQRGLGHCLETVRRVDPAALTLLPGELLSQLGAELAEEREFWCEARPPARRGPRPR
jgi:hypothetical protein